MKQLTSVLLLAGALCVASATSISEEMTQLVSTEVANDVIKLFDSLPRDTVADRWVIDQWAFHAFDCAQHAGVSLPPNLKRHKPSSSGTWKLPENPAATCKALRNGPNLSCHSFRSTLEPFTLEPQGNRHYSYLKRDFIEPISTVIGAECLLVQGEPSTRQYLTAQGEARWLIRPSIKPYNTASGVKHLNAGTVSLSIEGLPEQPVTVILLDQK